MLLNEKLRGLPPTSTHQLGDIRSLWTRFVAVVTVKCRTAAGPLREFIVSQMSKSVDAPVVAFFEVRLDRLQFIDYDSVMV